MTATRERDRYYGGACMSDEAASVIIEDLDLIYARAAAKWDRIPAGALRIGCKGCVAAHAVYCGTCPVRVRWERRHPPGSVMPDAKLRGCEPETSRPVPNPYAPAT